MKSCDFFKLFYAILGFGSRLGFHELDFEKFSSSRWFGLSECWEKFYLLLCDFSRFSATLFLVVSDINWESSKYISKRSLCDFNDSSFLRKSFHWLLNSIKQTYGCNHFLFLSNYKLSKELFRRFVWNFFRLENEHLNNCGKFRAVRDLTITKFQLDDLAGNIVFAELYIYTDFAPLQIFSKMFYRA